MIVMDPLALPLSCTCVQGTGQRRYDVLAVHLEKALGQRVIVTFDESLALALGRTGGRADLIIGKDAMVRSDAAKAGAAIREIAALSDVRGTTELRGVFIVRKDSPVKSLADLAGKSVRLGPVEDEETHGAARAALRGIDAKIDVAGSIDSAALAVGDGEADAAVVSEFLPVLLEGCGKLEKGATRIVGETPPVPFVRVFAGAAVDGATEQRIAEALATAPLDALETKTGFIDTRGWPDWRGPGRAGRVLRLPQRLDLEKVWSVPLTGPAMAGVAATERFVVVPDKSTDASRDIFRCLDASDGRELWKLEYDAPGEMEYSNAPRATPVLHDGLAYLQGAHGDLHCVELTTGRVAWRANLFRDFGAVPLHWGSSVSPLVVDEKLIVAPGAKDASLAALDRRTGRVIWKSPGHAAAYSAFIAGTFGGVRQLVGYDSASLGGWDIASGKRLWELVPAKGADFNVVTPVPFEGGLLLASENNATRAHRFDERGRIVAEPVKVNDDLAPDTCTPAVTRGRVFGSAYGELFSLDRATLRTVWRVHDDAFQDHTNIVANDGRVLVWSTSGDIILLDATADEYRPLAKLRPFPGKGIDSLAHPAFVGDRIYLRSPSELLCARLR